MRRTVPLVTDVAPPDWRILCKCRSQRALVLSLAPYRTRRKKSHLDHVSDPLNIFMLQLILWACTAGLRASLASGVVLASRMRPPCCEVENLRIRALIRSSTFYSVIQTSPSLSFPPILLLQLAGKLPPTRFSPLNSLFAPPRSCSFFFECSTLPTRTLTPAHLVAGRWPSDLQFQQLFAAIL